MKGVFLLVERAFELGFGKYSGDFGVLLIELLLGYFALFVEIGEHLQVINFCVDDLVIVEPALGESKLFLDGFSFFGVVPKFGVEGFVGEIFYFENAVIDVKDTSSVLPVCL